MRNFPISSLVVISLAVSGCSLEMALDTMLSGEHEQPPGVPRRAMVVRVVGMDSPDVSLLDPAGAEIDATVEACQGDDAPAECPESGGGIFLVRFPGGQGYGNLRVVATQGARSLRTVVAGVEPVASVYDTPELLDAGTIDLVSTAAALLVEAKASAMGLGMGGLPPDTLTTALQDVTDLAASGDEAVARFFHVVEVLDQAAADGSGGPVFVSPSYGPGYQVQAGGTSALNPEYIASNPVDYDEDHARRWQCLPGDPLERCPEPKPCTDRYRVGHEMRFRCPGVKRDGRKVDVPWCRCQADGSWSCLEEPACPAPGDGTVDEYVCRAAPDGDLDAARVDRCTYHTWCMDVVRCVQGQDDPDLEACADGVPADRVELAAGLIGCAQGAGCELDDQGCLEERCGREWDLCAGGKAPVCSHGDTRQCQCEGGAEGVQRCGPGGLDWLPCDCRGDGAEPDWTEPTSEPGRWYCLQDPERRCFVPEGACGPEDTTVDFVCPDTQPRTGRAEHPLVDWCTCQDMPDADTEAFDRILKQAAQRFEFSRICFADTDLTRDSPCFVALACVQGCGDEHGCRSACREGLGGTAASALDAMAGCVDHCLGEDDQEACWRETCPEELDRCLDWDGDPSTCWGGTCTIRVVFTADFREGRLDGNCAKIDRFKWTESGPGPMHFTGGVHPDDLLPISQDERSRIHRMLGAWVPNVIRMYDDGTNGDLVAGDGIWTIVFDLPVGLRMGYKYTYGPDRHPWGGTEEWPGNQRILEIRDVNGDHFVTRHDDYGDEATNKDQANLNGRNPDQILQWDEDVNQDGIPDTMERPYDLDGDCTLDDWVLLSTATPITVPCPGGGDD